MFALGTAVNAVAVVAGSVAGMLLKRGIGDRTSSALMRSVGIATVFIGASGALSEILTVTEGGLSTRGIMLMCVSLALGTVFGEFLGIEERLENVAERLKKLKLFSHTNSGFADGFVSSTLVICVGAMAIVGPIRDTLYGDCSVLFTKSLLDFISTMILASTLGVGVLCSVIPMVIYQGAFSIFARILEPYLYSLGDGMVVANISLVGGVLIFCVGVNLAFGKRLRVGNMLPALLVPPIYAIIQTFSSML